MQKRNANFACQQRLKKFAAQKVFIFLKLCVEAIPAKQNCGVKTGRKL